MITDSMAWLARRDGSVVVGYGPFEAMSEAPSEGIAFYVGDFAFKETCPWRIPSRVVVMTRGEFAGSLANSELLGCQWQPLDTAPFSAVFQEIMESIRGGFFEKTVPVVTELGVADRLPQKAVLAAMSQPGLPLQPYGWVDGERGFAGATPELLFSLSGDHLETMALAGTARNEDRDIFALDEKEIREHEYVAQTLVSKLVDLGALERLPRRILELGSIVHFLTTIQLRFDGRVPTAGDLLRRLHPTPALGPLPRTRETLAKLFEWRQRLGCPAEFGAPFGVWDHGHFEAVVAIRGVWWDGLQLQLPAGCGMIEASRLVSEWRELRLKRQSVLRLLNQSMMDYPA